MKKSFFVFCLCTLALFGCKKYPEGGLHKLSKQHIYGTWKLKEYYLNNFDYSNEIWVVNLKETFNEGGGFNRNYVDTTGIYHSHDGGWDIAGDKEVLKIFTDSTYKITPTATVLATNFTLQRLTKDELWYSFSAANGTHELHFSK